MLNRALSEPILNEQVRHAHWFNGRLLSAEALQTDQTAQRHAREQLGRAIGSGVVHGLTVAHTGGKKASVNISQGLALNRLGQVIELREDIVELKLGSPPMPQAQSAGLFAPCNLDSDDLVNDGFYLLAAAPTSDYQEQVPLHNIHDSGLASSCGSRYETAGMLLRLVPVDISNASLVDPEVAALLDREMETAVSDIAARSRLRNLMAHWCLGTFDIAKIATNLYAHLTASRENPMGLADRLRDPNIKLLDDCDVPLALLYWTKEGIQFVDMWAVRRQLLTDTTKSRIHQQGNFWLESFYQFLLHIEDLARTVSNAALVEIQDYFYYLPPVGLFPIKNGTQPGFASQRLFSHFATYRAGRLHTDQLTRLLWQSASYSAIDLTKMPTTIQTYQIEENQQAIDGGGNQRHYQAFVARRVHGPIAQDGVVQTGRQAWLVYRDIVRRQVFLPRAVDADAVDARLAITDSLRDVMSEAKSLNMVAAPFALDTNAALEMFTHLFQAQDDLATLFRANIPGTIHQATRQSFGNTLDSHLHRDRTGEPVGLLPAIQSGNLFAAVAAQKRINTFVGQWIGDSVAIGFIRVTYQSSPRGDQLAKGDGEAYPYRFTVSNRTNQQLTILLAATIRPDWDGNIAIHNQAGESIKSVTLASDTSQIVTVWVSVPETAELGMAVPLQLQATVPEPHNKQSTDNRLLTITEAPGPPIIHNIELTPVNQPDGTDDLAAGARLIYTYDIALTSEEDITAEFTSTVTLQAISGSVTDWFIDFGGAPREIPAPGIFITTYNLDANNTSPQRITIRIRAPRARGAEDETVIMTILTHSTEILGLEADEQGPFTLRLRADS